MKSSFAFWRCRGIENSHCRRVWEGGSNKRMQPVAGGHQVKATTSFHSKDSWPRDPNTTLIDLFASFYAFGVWKVQKIELPTLLSLFILALSGQLEGNPLGCRETPKFVNEFTGKGPKQGWQKMLQTGPMPRLLGSKLFA